MVKHKYEIIWDVEAKDYLKIAIKYIKKESPQGAKKVKTEIFKSVKALADNPFIAEADKLRKHNKGNYRALIVFHFRITYKITDNSIQIIRIRHTSQEPLEY